MSRVVSALALAATVLVAASADAQWFNYPTPGIPRAADGKPDLKAPAPLTPDGKPSLAGTWRVNAGTAYANIVTDLADNEVMPWAEALSRQRMSDLGKDDSSTIGCLPRGPRYITNGGGGGGLVKIIQTPSVIVMMYEELAYRQVYMDGRTLPKDPNPSFMGYSVGRWEGDVLVVESIGFNDRTWLDFAGHPHTESLRITERYRRISVGRMELQVTFEDAGAYGRPWTVPVDVTLASDTDLLEFVCGENDGRRASFTGRTPEQQRISLPPATLAEYAGTYVPPAAARLPFPFKSLQIRNVGSDLFLDIDGRGKLLMVPLSTTLWSIRVISLDFKRDETGAVTRSVIVGYGNEVVLTKQR